MGCAPDRLYCVSFQWTIHLYAPTWIGFVAIFFGYITIVKRVCEDDATCHLVVLCIFHLRTPIDTTVVGQSNLPF